ncbi:N-acetyl-D-Glu racemase DgcA [Caulobacter sp. DWR2-3-1b2]|uniref:N-acetyl-D-Glu racemase DgcA n=1 Tax=Caulobacter sp. DWR2-3-1b2 TaxID=2804642 RepID=UPI00198F5794|nr:dipeptide epimerase [Caulobacter sp.]
MQRTVSIVPVSHRLKAPFRISRGVKTAAETVVVEVVEGDLIGRGECVPYARYDETVESVIAELQPPVQALRDGAAPHEALALLTPGAARNALDCALWDLRAKREGLSVEALTALRVPDRLITAVTISLDTVEAMGAAALVVASAPLIKVKLSADDPAARLLAVARAAPHARLIVDPNEGWDFATLDGLKPILSDLNIALVEQPLPAGEDMALEGYDPPYPICADESVHTAEDLAALKGRYGAVNLKLDKAGGLTEGLLMLEEARNHGFTLMVGCMVASSLAIAPALHLAGSCAFADLDGPWWLAEDYPGGARVADGWLTRPAEGFWGDGVTAAGLWL